MCSDSQAKTTLTMASVIPTFVATDIRTGTSSRSTFRDLHTVPDLHQERPRLEGGPLILFVARTYPIRLPCTQAVPRPYLQVTFQVSRTLPPTGTRALGGRYPSRIHHPGLPSSAIETQPGQPSVTLHSPTMLSNLVRVWRPQDEAQRSEVPK